MLDTWWIHDVATLISHVSLCMWIVPVFATCRLRMTSRHPSMCVSACDKFREVGNINLLDRWADGQHVMCSYRCCVGYPCQWDVGNHKAGKREGVKSEHYQCGLELNTLVQMYMTSNANRQFASGPELEKTFPRDNGSNDLHVTCKCQCYSKIVSNGWAKIKKKLT